MYYFDNREKREDLAQNLGRDIGHNAVVGGEIGVSGSDNVIENNAAFPRFVEAAHDGDLLGVPGDA